MPGRRALGPEPVGARCVGPPQRVRHRGPYRV